MVCGVKCEANDREHMAIIREHKLEVFVAGVHKVKQNVEETAR